MNMIIKEVADSFKSFEKMYECLFKKNGSMALKRELGTNEYPEIRWLIEYFTEKEEYEKCENLKNLQLPKVNDDQINKEIEWLKQNNL